MSERKLGMPLKIIVFLGHAAWLGMRLAGIVPTNALLVAGTFCGWLAVLVYGCVLPTLKQSKVIHD